ncbi:MAG: radical SAM protein [Hyphomicrobiales bacterium]
MPTSRKRRILIVNAYFDPWRSASPTRLFVPRAMAPYYLAGYFDRDHCEVRVWDEMYHGALLKRSMFEWPDIVVFTGLTAAFDRARQLAAYCRHFSSKVVTIIGGPIARALPAICNEVFDYTCQGDVDEIGQVIESVLDTRHLSDDTAPRFDLTAPSMGVGYLETTKNCNFACSFCSLSGEGRAYAAHSKVSIENQLDAMGKSFAVMVLDNNFYGNNRKSFEARVRMIGERWRQGQFRGWGALVTGDFFKRPENLKLMAENGCKGIFSGVENLDPQVLKNFNKKQSLTSDPKSLTEACAEHSISFDYGMIVDFGQQTITEIEDQISGILSDRTIPLPSLLSLTIPIVGTPYFEEAARTGRLMPNVLLSDMDGQKLVEWPKEPLERVVPFLRDLLQLRGRKLALARHSLGHAWHWRKHYEWEQTVLAAVRPLHRFYSNVGLGSPRQIYQSFKEPVLTYNATTDKLRGAYRPLFRMPTHFAKDFKPLSVTDVKGVLADQFLEARTGATSLAS